MVAHAPVPGPLAMSLVTVVVMMAAADIYGLISTMILIIVALAATLARRGKHVAMVTVRALLIHIIAALAAIPAL